MTYRIFGCIPVAPDKATALHPVVDRIASYAGDSGSNFCALFSDEHYAAICFPGVSLELPPVVVAELEAEIAALAIYMVGDLSINALLQRIT